MAALPLTDVRRRLGALVRRAAGGGERITITDQGQPVAVIVSVQELANIEDELALARLDARQARSEVVYLAQVEVRRRLGIPAG